MDKNMSAKEVSEITGVSTRILQFWVNHNLISTRETEQGHARQYSLLNIFEVMLIEQFKKLGIRLRIIKRIFKRLKIENPDLLEFVGKTEIPPIKIILARGNGNLVSVENTFNHYEPAAYIQINIILLYQSLLNKLDRTEII